MMPVDLEMILSASPPLFSTAAFMDFRYNPFHGPHNHHNKFSTSFNDFRDNPNFGPIRPCLSEKAEDQRSGKKRVWFADDKGLALTHVRIMSEPSNCPPRWTDEFLEQVTKGMKAAANATSDVRWEPLFPQPASDYIEFRSRLQKNCVSLENVIIREDEENLTGTIKVKNIAFDKEVYVHITFNRWNTSEDVPAVFVPSGLEGGTSLYDTFSFSVSIPSSAAKFQTVEFCVCFRCSGTEYWDNNNGENYKLAVSKKSVPQPVMGNQFKDALKANLDSWSEFASWSHLITEGPYW